MSDFDDNAEKHFNMAMKETGQHIIVAITGASGASYALSLMKRLGAQDVMQHVLISEAARVVMAQEADLQIPVVAREASVALTQELGLPEERLRVYSLNDWFSPVASGSAGVRQMVVVPCSMGTMARIATGASGNLIERAADVILKECRKLILVPRETPLSSIHLEHMLKLSKMGVHVIPAMPGFYHRPASVDEMVDFVVDRIIDHLDLSDGRAKRWGD